MKKNTFYQTIGALYDHGFAKEAVVLAKESWLEKKVKNPETGNMVKVKNLPEKYKERYRPKKAPKEKKQNKPAQHLPEEEAKRELGALSNARQKAIEKLDEIYKIPLEQAKDEEMRKAILKDKAKHQKVALKEFDSRIDFLKGQLGSKPLKGIKIDPEKRKQLQEEQKQRKKQRKEGQTDKPKKDKPKTQPSEQEPIDISIFNKRPSELEDEDIFDFLMKIKETSGI